MKIAFLNFQLQQFNYTLTLFIHAYILHIYTRLQGVKLQLQQYATRLICNLQNIPLPLNWTNSLREILN